MQRQQEFSNCDEIHFHCNLLFEESHIIFLALYSVQIIIIKNTEELVDFFISAKMKQKGLHGNVTEMPHAFILFNGTMLFTVCPQDWKNMLKMEKYEQHWSRCSKT